MLQPIKHNAPPNQLQHFYELEENLQEYMRLRSPVSFKEAYDHCLRCSKEEDLAILFWFVLNQCTRSGLDLELMLNKLAKYAAITKTEYLDGLFEDTDPAKNPGPITPRCLGSAREVIRSRHDPLPLNNDPAIEDMFGIEPDSLGSNGTIEFSYTYLNSALNEEE